MINNNMTLIHIEKELEERLRECDLISDLDLSLNEYEAICLKIKTTFSTGSGLYLLNIIVEQFKVTFATFLVYTALYKYNGDFWSHVENFLGLSGNEARRIIGESFLYTIRKYNLKEFSDGGYKYVTPIVCHSGIPNYSLGDLFELIYGTIDGRDFSPQYMIDEIKYFIQYKVDKTVHRFIIHNEDKTVELFQNIRDLIMGIENGVLTREDSYLSFDYIDKRIIDEYFKWKENKTVFTKAARKRRYILTSPKIKLDSGGIGVYMNLPVQTIKDRGEDYIEWIIEYGEDKEERSSTSSELFYSGDGLISEEKTYRMRAAERYNVSLYLGEEKIGAWEFPGISKNKPFMIFDIRDNLVKNEYISSDTVTVLYMGGLSLQGDYESFIEIPSLPGEWSRYRVASLKFRNGSEGLKLVSKDCSAWTVDYKMGSFINLKGGKYLFDEEPDVDGIPVYSGSLPKLSIEYNNDILKEHIINEYRMVVRHRDSGAVFEVPVKDLEYEDRNFEILVCLERDGILDNSMHGEFEIRVLERRSLKKIFAIRNIPEILYRNDSSGKWPSGRGYSGTYFMYSAPDGIVLSFDGETKRENVVYRGESYIKVYTNSPQGYLTGRLNINAKNGEKSYPVKKRIRNLQWAWWNSSEEALNWDRTAKTLYLDDITGGEKVDLILKLNGIEQEFLYCMVTLKNGIGSELQSKTIRLYNNKSSRFGIEEFLNTIESLGLKKYYISITLMDDNNNIAEFTPGVIKERVYIKDIKYDFRGENEVFITWHQEGSLEDKCIKTYSITKPWEDEKSVFINEERLVEYKVRNGILLGVEELGFTEPGIYGLRVDDESDGFFTEEKYYCPRIKKGMFLEYKVDELISSYDYEGMAVEEYIPRVIGSFKSKKLKELYSNIGTINYDINKMNARKVLLGIYTLLINLKNIKEIAGEGYYSYVNAVLKRLISKCSKGNGKYLLLKELIRLRLDGKVFEKLIDRLRLYDLLSVKEGILTISDRDFLWNNNYLSAFIYEMRNMNPERTPNVNAISGWISDEVLESILIFEKGNKKCPEMNLRSCIANMMKGECRCNHVKFNGSKNLIGSVEDYQKVFEQNLELIHKSNMDKINLMKHFSDEGIKIFGKGYVTMIYEWNASYDGDYKSRFNNIISDSLDGLKRVCGKYGDIDYIKRMEHVLQKRMDFNKNSLHNYLYYFGMAALLKGLDACGAIRLKDNGPDADAIDRFYRGFYKYFNEFFIRDTIIMELYILYLRNGGKLQCR